MDPAPAPPACRNCGAPIAGDYCACCGQETRMELPTFRSCMLRFGPYAMVVLLPAFAFLLR